MGAVYLACKDHQRYAMKILHHLTDEDERPDELRRRFTREAELCTGFHHPHIVEIVEFGVDERLGRPFMVMELLTGVPLHELRRRHPTLDYRDKTRILIQLADALAAIHERGICHRDLKPSNILVDDQFQVKVTDFGVAYLPGSELTLTSELLGSPAYMAPESFESPRVDWRADLFAFGVLAYEFYLGRLPFAADNIADTAAAIAHRKPPEPRSLDAGFPPALQLVLGQLLRKEPAARYQSAKALAEALQAYLAEDPQQPGWEHRSVEDLGRLLLANDWE
jgi:serine/threonine-protein kinase